MSIESLLISALGGLVSGRIYPDVAPENAVRPYLTYQQVGGQAINFLDQAPPSKKNRRFQINVWADTRTAASAMADQVELLLRQDSALQTSVLGSPVATFDEETKRRGTRQDFSFWT